MKSRESRNYIIFCSKLSNGKVAIVWKTLTVLNANARSALGAPGQTAAFRIAVRLLSVTIILSLEIPLVVSAISDPIRHPVPKSVLVAECSIRYNLVELQSEVPSSKPTALNQKKHCLPLLWTAAFNRGLM